MGRSAGSILRSLRKLGGGRGFRAVREGILLFASKARYGPIPLRLDVFWRSAGSVLRSQEGLGEEGAFARCARVFGDRLQCLLWTDPAPLGVLVERSAGSVLRSLRKLGEGWGFRAVREGFLVFASKARCGPIPLLLGEGLCSGAEGFNSGCCERRCRGRR
jgi:hypothetical protein